MGSGDSVEGFTRWYSRILRTVVHIDTSDDSFILFHRAMKAVYRLSKPHAETFAKGERIDRPARPASSVYHDRLKRSIAVREVSISKSSKAGASSKASSPRAKLTLSQPSTGSLGSSRRSLVRSSSQESKLDLTQLSQLALDLPPPSDDGSLSPASRSQVTDPGGVNQGFDPKLREAVWLLAEEFPNTSTLLHGFYKTNLNKGRIVALTFEALMRRCKSPASTRGVVRNVKGLITFPLENRDDENPTGFTLTGESSVALFHDYIESTADRGRTVPGAVRTSLSTWAESLGIDWPLENPIVCAAAHVDSNEVPKHAPPMKLDTIKKLEELALNVEVAPFKRAFADGASLRHLRAYAFPTSNAYEALR